MSGASILITGSNRGIGLGLVKKFLQLDFPPKYIFATCRNPSQADDLNLLASANKGKVHVLKLEVTDYGAFEAVKNTIEEIVGEDGLNLLINNAGILPPENNRSPDSMRNTFEINCVATYFFTQALLPLLKKAATKRAKLNVSAERSAIVMMSSNYGSIGHVSDIAFKEKLEYCCSKSALNMAMKIMSNELKNSNILVSSIHPGWVKTDMGGDEGNLTTEECCSALIKTMFELTEKDQGSFKTWDNQIIPW